MKNILSFSLILLTAIMFAQTNFTATSYMHLPKNSGRSIPTDPQPVNIPMTIDIEGKKVSVHGPQEVNLTITNVTDDYTSLEGDKFATYNSVNENGLVCYIMHIKFKIPNQSGNNNQLYLTYTDHVDVYDFKS